jgi:hypothetical protein
MNIYFLVEGRRTEKKVYPKWMGHLLPELTEVKNPFDVEENAFYVFNGNGFPSLLHNHLENAVADCNSIGKFQYLVICLDADEVTATERMEEVLDFVKARKINLNNGIFKIVVQNRCIETWFLGNRKVYSRQPQSAELRKFNAFYNVQVDDPEQMGKPDGYEIHAHFHEAYLSEMLAEKNVKYTKKYPSGVVEKHYLEELIARNRASGHMPTFGVFLNFCQELRQQLEMHGNGNY